MDGNVRDDALIDIEGLGLAVMLQVNEKEADRLGGLSEPSVYIDSKDLALNVSLSEMISETNNGLMLKYLVHVVDGSLDSHTFDSVGEVVCDLEIFALILHFGIVVLVEIRSLGVVQLIFPLHFRQKPANL